MCFSTSLCTMNDTTRLFGSSLQSLFLSFSRQSLNATELFFQFFQQNEYLKKESKTVKLYLMVSLFLFHFLNVTYKTELNGSQFFWRPERFLKLCFATKRPPSILLKSPLAISRSKALFPNLGRYMCRGSKCLTNFAYLRLELDDWSQVFQVKISIPLSWN